MIASHLTSLPRFAIQYRFPSLSSLLASFVSMHTHNMRPLAEGQTNDRSSLHTQKRETGKVSGKGGTRKGRLILFMQGTLEDTFLKVGCRCGRFDKFTRFLTKFTAAAVFHLISLP